MIGVYSSGTDFAVEMTGDECPVLILRPVRPILSARAGVFGGPGDESKIPFGLKGRFIVGLEPALQAGLLSRLGSQASVGFANSDLG